MEAYEIKQSENGVSKSYTLLLEKISEHVNVLAKNGKPITRVMGIKRGLYRLKRGLGLVVPDQPNSALIEARKVLKEDIRMLVGDVQDKLNVDVLEAVEVGMVGEKELKRGLIKYDYDKLAKDGLKYKEIKEVLSEKYGFSISSIEKLVYK